MGNEAEAEAAILVGGVRLGLVERGERFPRGCARMNKPGSHVVLGGRPHSGARSRSARRLVEREHQRGTNRRATGTPSRMPAKITPHQLSQNQTEHHCFRPHHKR